MHNISTIPSKTSILRLTHIEMWNFTTIIRSVNIRRQVERIISYIRKKCKTRNWCLHRILILIWIFSDLPCLCSDGGALSECFAYFCRVHTFGARHLYTLTFGSVLLVCYPGYGTLNPLRTEAVNARNLADITTNKENIHCTRPRQIY